MKLQFLLTLVLAPLLGGCEWFHPTYSWHQKMTVEVETPDGIKIGSSVTAIKWVEGSNPVHGWNTYIEGEAVVVHIDKGHYLFILLRSISHNTDVSLMLASTISKQNGRRAISSKLFTEVVLKRDRASGLIELPVDQYPTLVTFNNISDPSSVQKVTPLSMAKYFGNGVRLKRITLEVTDEPVTRGIVGKFLTWLGEYPEPSLPPASVSGTNKSDATFNRLVHHGDFRRTFYGKQ